MNQTPIWELPKSERKRITDWRETLRTQIQDRITTIQRLRNTIAEHEFHQKAFENQLTLLEERFKFD